MTGNQPPRPAAMDPGQVGQVITRSGAAWPACPATCQASSGGGRRCAPAGPYETSPPT